MSLLDTATWNARLYSSGWRTGSGGPAPVTESATGHQLGEFGLADESDVAAAAAVASVAQSEWAARRYDERAAVLRRAGALWGQYAADVHEWLIREAGSIPPKAAVETDIAAQECFEAAAAAALPYGQLLRTPQPRLSMAVRAPVGVVGVIARSTSR